MDNKITYEKFRELLLKEVRKSFSAEFLLETHDIVKNNGVHLESLTIRREEQKLSPNFYLPPLYQQYQQGSSMAELTHHITCLYQQSMRDYADFKVDVTYESCKEKIILRLVSGNWNDEILEQIPHIPFLDMVILFYVVMQKSEEGIGSVRISNQMQEQWGISTRILFQLALDNSLRLFPQKINSLINVLEERVAIGGQKEFISFMEGQYHTVHREAPLVITNQIGINGATVILYPGLLEKIGEMLDSDYYLLPSSIHEFLAIPCCCDLSGEKLEAMVHEVNRSCVAKEELLSEKVYYFHRQSGKISIWE